MSGMSLLFPILNIAATCEIKIKAKHKPMEKMHHNYARKKSNSVTYPFILNPRWLCCSHLKNGATKAPNVHGKAVAITIHNNLKSLKRKNVRTLVDFSSIH
jgi:hypothetical protein